MDEERTMDPNPQQPAPKPVQDPEDTRKGLARALAETHLECLSAEHDLGRLLSEGRDFMHSRYGAHRLEDQPEHLDHWAWHHAAMADAVEQGGIGEVPALPYTPQVVRPGAPAPAP